MFRGTYTALVTPFRGGEIDEAALRRLIDDQVAAGIDGIVPCGSTGESATLSHEEHERVIKISVEQAAGATKVIAGTGYPYCFQAVDAAAVLSVPDREAFYAQVQAFLERNGMRLRLAPKAASKRRRRA